MTVIHREHGLRFIIYVDDHEPAHVHVRGDGDVKIDLGRLSGEPALIFSKGMSTADIRRAMRVVTEQRATFLEEWRQIHG